MCISCNFVRRRKDSCVRLASFGNYQKHTINDVPCTLQSLKNWIIPISFEKRSLVLFMVFILWEINVIINLGIIKFYYSVKSESERKNAQISMIKICTRSIVRNYRDWILFLSSTNKWKGHFFVSWNIRLVRF